MATYTWQRWRTSPFQMYTTVFLLLVSTAQLGLGISPASPQAHLDAPTQMALSFCNFIGASITLYGLHLKNLHSSLRLELCGYLSLVFVLAAYIALLTADQYLAVTTYGFAFSEAFVYAAVHRSVQIFLYLRAHRKERRLALQVQDLRQTLLQAGVSPDDLPPAPGEADA